MEWKSYQNKHLIVPSYDNFKFQGKTYRKVILTPELDLVLYNIDKYWPPNSEIVTSGVRVPEDSLRIIRQYLISKGLDKKYPGAISCQIDDKSSNGQYIWQMAWSNLLNIGVIINPPYTAICLMDYIRSGVNKKGQLIGQSPHVKKKAFDLSGIDSQVIVKRLIEDKMIKGYLVERENNCVHCDIF
jgi:hypothetical protein